MTSLAASYIPASFLNDEPCGTVHTGIISEAGKDDRRILAGRKGKPAVIFPDDLEKRLTCTGYSSPDHDHFRVDNTGENSQCSAQILSHSFNNTDCQRVSCLKSIQNIFCRKIFFAAKDTFISG